jgi:hypothetical protein
MSLAVKRYKSVFLNSDGEKIGEDDYNEQYTKFVWQGDMLTGYDKKTIRKSNYDNGEVKVSTDSSYVEINHGSLGFEMIEYIYMNDQLNTKSYKVFRDSDGINRVQHERYSDSLKTFVYEDIFRVEKVYPNGSKDVVYDWTYIGDFTYVPLDYPYNPFENIIYMLEYDIIDLFCWHYYERLPSKVIDGETEFDLEYQYDDNGNITRMSPKQGWVSISEFEFKY